MGKSFIGLDISNSEVRMVQLRDKKTVLAVKRLPENLVKEDRVVAPETLSAFLRSMRREFRLSGSQCALILPDNSTVFRSITMPPVSVEQLKLNLPYEFRDYVGGESDDYYYDYAVVHTSTDDNGTVSALDILAAAASKKIVTDYASLLRHAGLRLKVALPREMAFVNLLRALKAVNPAEAPQTLAAPAEAMVTDRANGLVDIGSDHTRIYIFAGDHLLASKVVDIGCNQIDEAIAAALNVDVYLAASYRESNYENVLDRGECAAVYERIALEVMKAVNFFTYENSQAEFKDVYFCGTGADVTQLINVIRDTISFTAHDVRELLPAACRENAQAVHCALAVGVVL